jgi:hypothetical protein
MEHSLEIPPPLAQSYFNVPGLTPRYADEVLESGLIFGEDFRAETQPPRIRWSDARRRLPPGQWRNTIYAQQAGRWQPSEQTKYRPIRRGSMSKFNDNHQSLRVAVGMTRLFDQRRLREFAIGTSSNKSSLITIRR